MTKLIIREPRVKPVLSGHPWVFSGSLQGVPDGLTPGEIVEIVRENGDFVARGFFSSYSQIAVRVLTRDEKENIDDVFFKRRIERAWELRNKFVSPTHTNAFRLINAEHDDIPGVIIDWYNGVAVIQIHTKGSEVFLKSICDALVLVTGARAIVERSENKQRAREGLENRVSVLHGSVEGPVEILENGMKFLVDVIEGQKTGFFLDQRDKREALKKYTKDASVLNCFSYSGGFSVAALQAGAARVVSVDASASAIEMAKRNIELNGFGEGVSEVVVADVLKYISGIGVGEFDVIVLDPPAFIQHKDKVREGLSGYRKINTAAMRSMKSGSILLTCSCSHHLDLQQFLYMISESAAAAGRTAQLLELYTHSIDHPVKLSFLEGQYLKSAFVRII